MAQIHMDTDVVRQLVKELQESAHQMNETASLLQREIEMSPWQGGSRDEFCSQMLNIKSNLSNLAERKFELAQMLEREIQQWEEAASSFSSTASSPSPAVMGSVLGAATISSLTVGMDYQNMSWSERLAELQRLQLELSKLDGLDADQLRKKIAEIDRQMQDIQKSMDEAIHQESRLINRVFRQNGQSLSDTYKDIAENYEGQLASLTKIRDQYQQQLDQRIDLESGINSLSGILNNGIPADGPTTPAWLHNQLGGCTHYVATKRDVSAFGNGHPGNAIEWTNQAAKSGFEVGQLPVKGSIAVFNQASGFANTEAGHVGYVESVDLVEGGYKITYSHANTIYTDNSWLRGTHQMNKNGSIVIPAQGLNGVSFIYDKKK